MMALTLTDLAYRSVWVGWKQTRKNGRITKLPYDPRTNQLAQSDNPSTWATRGEAEWWALQEHGGPGLMFCQIDELHLGGIDLDTCHNSETGEVAPWAQEIIDRFHTYTEISPSQTGVKLFSTYRIADQAEISRLFDGKHGRSFKNGGGEHCPAIEIYRSNRFFTVTDEEIGRA